MDYSIHGYEWQKLSDLCDRLQLKLFAELGAGKMTFHHRGQVVLTWLARGWPTTADLVRVQEILVAEDARERFGNALKA